MITVDLYLLNGHKPSANIAGIADLYLKHCPGIVLRRQVVKSRAELMETIGKQRVPSIPAMEVPGEVVHGKKRRVFLTEAEEIEKWCRETVRSMDSANRRRR